MNYKSKINTKENNGIDSKALITYLCGHLSKIRDFLSNLNRFGQNYQTIKRKHSFGHKKKQSRNSLL